MAEHAHTTPTSRSPEAATPGATGRRRLFGTAAALAVVPSMVLGASPSAPSPDAELIRLCGEFDALERQRHGLDYEAMPGTPEYVASDAAWDAIHDAQGTILDAIERHPPSTMAGMAALARAALFEEAALHAADPHSHGGRLIWHMVEPLAGDAA